MYHYEPHLRKRGETLLFFACVLVAAILLGISNLATTLYPSVWQTFAVCCSVAAILLLVQYLCTRYSYTVGQKDGVILTDGEEAERELVITRHFRKRTTVVCRIPLTDICEVMPITPDNRRERRRLIAGKNYYRYTASLFDGSQFLLAVRNDEKISYVRILADDRLISLLGKT